MKKVVFVMVFFPLNKEIDGLGGAERRIFSIFERMSDERLSSSVIILCGENRASVEKLLSNYFIPNADVSYVSSVFELWKKLKKEKYDYICYNDSVMRSLPVMFGAMLAKGRKVVLVESLFRAYGLYRSTKERIGVNVIFRTADHLDTLYPSSKKRLDKVFPKLKETSTVPCALPRIENFLKEADKEKTIVFAGRLNEFKNPLIFTEAVVSCADEIRKEHYKCLICGIGPQYDEIKSRILNKKCDDIVSMMGYVNMEEIIPHCSVFCSLQQEENYPSQSLLEAIAAGCYCICTNVGDTEKIVKSEFGALIGINSEELKNEILRAMSFSKEQQDQICSSAKEFARQNFSIENSVRHYRNLFESELV